VVKNKAAEICEKYLSKGDKIYVEGRIKSRQWQTEEGLVKNTVEIQVTEFTFLSTKKNADDQKLLQNQELIKSSNFDTKKDDLPVNDLPF
jgi:single-strand DNA-binding protein